MAEKNYCKGILIKEFGEYGKLKVSIKIDEFYNFLKSIENNGWANIEIAKNKEVTAKGYTHHCYENTFKPDPNYKPQQTGGLGLPIHTADEPVSGAVDDDLPF